MTEVETLPCGVAVADLLDRHADGLPPSSHSAGCPYCGERLQILSAGWRRIQDAAAEPVEPPSGLTGRIIERLRSDWHAGGADLLLPDDRGLTRVRPGVVAALARDSAGRIPGVRVGHARYDGRRIELALRLRADTPVPELAERVRARVSADLTRMLGGPAPAVDLQITDVWQ